MNRARANPAAEVARLGIDLNQGLPPGTISPNAQQPLAPHRILIDAAGGHAQDMLDRDFFDHVNPDGLTAANRATLLGYPGTAGENIAWTGSTGDAVDMSRGVVDLHDGLVRSPGHRDNLFTPFYREAGPAARAGEYTLGGVSYNALFVVQKFGTTNVTYLTGVAYRDTVVRDAFYTIGEGLRDITVSATSSQGATFTTTTGPSGGYALPLTAGTYSVSFGGGGSEVAPTTVTVAAANVKLDFVDSTGSPQPDPNPEPDPDPDPPAPPPFGVVTIATARSRAYRPGERLEVTVTLSRPATVTGRPTLPLVVGSATRQATYARGSGTDQITFSYVVGRRDSAANVRIGSAFAFSQRIRIVAGNEPLSTALPQAGQPLPGVSFDSTPPKAVGSVRMPTPRTYLAGESLEFVVTFSEPVTVTGRPSIGLVGLQAAGRADYVSGSGGTQIVFRYELRPGDALRRGRSDVSLDRGIKVGGGGAIVDAAGNAATTRIVVPRTSGVRVDTASSVLASGVAAAGATGLRAGRAVPRAFRA